MQIRVSPESYMCGFGLHVWDERGGKLYVPEKLCLKEGNEFLQKPPILKIDRKEGFQDLMDDLWNIGLRPTQKADSYKAEVEAIKFHLEDMRTLVFHATKGVRNDTTS